MGVVMKFNKLRYTQTILDMAYKLPFIFPKKMEYFSREYNSKSEYIVNKNNEPPKITNVSLFEGDFFWKAISFSMLVNNLELEKLKSWREKKSLFFNRSERLNIDSNSFDNNGGWINIGILRINDNGFQDDLKPVYTDNNNFKSVYITLTKYSSGFSFLTFYVYLNEDVTNLVRSVPVPRMKYLVELDSFNLWSSKGLGMIMHDYENYAEQLINHNIKSVNDKAFELIDYLLSEIKIKKNKKELYCVFDFYLNQTAPYFNDEVFSSTQQHLVIHPKYKKFNNFKMSEEDDDSFIRDYRHNIKGVDLMYLKTCPESQFSEYNNFKLRYCSNAGSHLAIVSILLLTKKLDALSENLNNSRLHDAKVSMDKLHERLFSVSYELKMIKAWLKPLRKEVLFNLSPSFINYARKEMEYQISRIDDLKEVTDEIYSLSENRIQINNLRYNKRYSLVVFIFILIQVALAAMTIDWGKKNVWYTPVMSWLKNLL